MLSGNRQLVANLDACAFVANQPTGIVRQLMAIFLRKAGFYGVFNRFAILGEWCYLEDRHCYKV